MIERFAAFAAERNAKLEDFDKEMASTVSRALEHYHEDDWYEPIVTGASVLWKEIFEKESPTGDSEKGALALFQRELTDSLKHTAEPNEPPTDGQINRVLYWLGAYTVNSATLSGARDAEHTEKTWITMHDNDVRALHRAVDGQTVPILGAFTVGGNKLQFPGEPVGPPDVWINCRCLIAVTGGPKMAGKNTSFASAPAAPDVDELDDTDENDDTLLDDEMQMTPWHGVLVVEGTPTGDGRQFDDGSLDYDSFPMPITFQRASSDGHNGSVSVGRIDNITKVGNQHRATGMFNLNVPEAHEVIDGLIFGNLGGVSVDVDSPSSYVEFPEGSDDEGEMDLMGMLFGGGGEGAITHFTAGRIRSASIVQIPAFSEAYVALGPDFSEDVRNPETGAGFAELREGEAGTDDPMTEAYGKLADAFEVGDMRALSEAYDSITASVSFAPGTHDGPGWLKNPEDTQRLRRYWTRGKGAAKINWGVPGDFNRCRMYLGKYVNPAYLAGTCANLHKVAIGVWPGMEDGGRKHHREHSTVAADPGFSIVASAASASDPADWFKDPGFSRLTQHTVTKDGRVYGHLAAWGTCHLGIGEKCIMPPYSLNNYGNFRLGSVLTEEGMVSTGPIVMWTGHAGDRASAAAAARHYDDTGHAIADVAMGEDAFGIWYAGKVRDGASAKDIKAFRASALSGDWRRVASGQLELIAALAVNAPGYPIQAVSFAMEGTEQLSLIASGGMLRPPTPRSITASLTASADDLLAIGRVVADELEFRAARKERIAKVRDPKYTAEAAAARAARVAAAKSLKD